MGKGQGERGKKGGKGKEKREEKELFPLKAAAATQLKPSAFTINAIPTLADKIFQDN